MTQTYIHKDLGKILIYYSPKARSIRVQVGDNGIKLIIFILSDLKLVTPA